MLRREAIETLHYLGGCEGSAYDEAKGADIPHDCRHLWAINVPATAAAAVGITAALRRAMHGNSKERAATAAVWTDGLTCAEK